jgi:1,4-dihydroxy-6-naphthoate synthase
MTSPLSLGFSPCPNDTFIFHALVHGLVAEAPEFAPVLLEDVETLNRWVLSAKLDVSKLSFHALGHVLDHYVLLRAGAALGRGCGPLLVARSKLDPAELAGRRLGIPGRYTTAAMLLGLFAPACLRDRAGTGEAAAAGNLQVMRFDRIMPALVRGEIDAGVIIHESRFTYRDHGLVLLADLGTWWEEISGLPIPLGGIVARRSLGGAKLAAIEAAIRASLERARENPAGAMAYIRRHAGELDEGVLRAHIELYVNRFSLDLGEEGERAVTEFLSRGRAAGILPAAGAEQAVLTAAAGA